MIGTGERAVILGMSIRKVPTSPLVVMAPSGNIPTKSPLAKASPISLNAFSLNTESSVAEVMGIALLHLKKKERIGLREM